MSPPKLFSSECGEIKLQTDAGMMFSENFGNFYAHTNRDNPVVKIFQL